MPLASHSMRVKGKTSTAIASKSAKVNADFFQDDVPGRPVKNNNPRVIIQAASDDDEQADNTISSDDVAASYDIVTE